MRRTKRKEGGRRSTGGHRKEGPWRQMRAVLRCAFQMRVIDRRNKPAQLSGQWHIEGGGRASQSGGGGWNRDKEAESKPGQWA